jgi:hypothetical protein
LETNRDFILELIRNSLNEIELNDNNFRACERAAELLEKIGLVKEAALYWDKAEYFENGVDLLKK